MAEALDKDRGGYSEAFIAQVQLLWGEGFLSPGGAAEVAEALAGLDLHGKEVLDIGVGLGGPACALAEAHGAARVVGIDVQESVLAKAAAIVRKRGLADRIVLQPAAPGPVLPFPGARFDVVFSKETIVYIDDKAGLFGEAYRVLRPNGWIVISDWYAGDALPAAALDFWRKSAGVHAELVSFAAQAALLRQAGFADITATDRSAWYAEVSRRDAARLQAERGRLETMLGTAAAETLIQQARMTAVMVARGWLYPGHLRGRKPG